MALRSAGFAILAMAGLAACGTAADDPLLNAARGLASGLFDRGDTAAGTVVDPRQVLTREMIDSAATPLILVEGESLAGSATMVRIGANGPNETWEGNSEITMTFSYEGVLRATRGMPFDLSAADIEGTRRALRARHSGPVQRSYSHVVGDVETQIVAYTCTLQYFAAVPVTIFGAVRQLTPAVESCNGQSTDQERIENRFWIDQAGIVWVSEQWAGPELGYFQTERLYR